MKREGIHRRSSHDTRRPQTYRLAAACLLLDGGIADLRQVELATGLPAGALDRYHRGVLLVALRRHREHLRPDCDLALAVRCRTCQGLVQVVPCVLCGMRKQEPRYEFSERSLRARTQRQQLAEHGETLPREPVRMSFERGAVHDLTD